MAVKCRNCGGPHAVWDCRQKSTAALKETQVRKHRCDTVFPSDHQAGTQALPVDTNSTNYENVAAPSTRFMEVATTFAGTVGNEDRHTNLARSAHKGENPRHADGSTPLTQTRPTKRGRGRPRTITDMKVYKALKAREYRRRKKENGKATAMGD
jgi:hypothetical protein